MHNPNTKGLIVKDNSLIDARYKLSVYELRIFNYLISRVSKNDDGLTEYVLSFSEISDRCNIDPSNLYKDIKKSLKKLKSRVIEIENNKEWNILSIFDKATINKGNKGNYINKVTFLLSEDIRSLILDIKKNFTKIDFYYIRSLNSIYSIRFYEISLFQLRSRLSCTYYLNVSYIKKILDIEGKYSRFDSFKKSVLMITKEEINEKTNLNFDFENIPSEYDKRKIEKIKFVVSRKNKEKEVVKIEEKQIEEVNYFDDEEQELFDKVMQYGVDNRKAELLIKNYSLNQITEALEVVQYDLNNSNKNITNVAGYVVSAIEKSFKVPIEIKDKELKIKIHHLNKELENLNNQKTKIENDISKDFLLKVKEIFLNEKELFINNCVKKMIVENNKQYEFALSIKPKIKEYSSRQLVEKNSPILAYQINLMLNKYANEKNIEYDEDSDKKKTLSDIEDLISKTENKIELSKNLKFKLT